SSPGTNWAFGFHEITKYMYLPGVHSPMACDPTIIRRDAWESLSPDLQALIHDANKATLIDAIAFMDAGDVVGMKNYEAYEKANPGKFEIRVLDIEVQKEIYNAILDYWDAYIAKGEDEFFNKVYADQKEFIDGVISVQGQVWANVAAYK
ncbi:hypothetical protein ACFLV3_07450, partial [Chloroflexota bacterium]